MIDLEAELIQPGLKLNLIADDEGVDSQRVTLYVYEVDNKLFHPHTLVLPRF